MQHSFICKCQYRTILLCSTLSLKKTHIFYIEISFWKVTKFSDFFLKINLPLKKRSLCGKKCLSDWVTVFKKEKVCHTVSLCLIKKTCLSHWVTVFKMKRYKMVKNCQKRSKMISFWPFLTFFDHFWPFFLKHSDSVRQTFFSQAQWLSLTNFF